MNNFFIEFENVDMIFPDVTINNSIKKRFLKKIFNSSDTYPSINITTGLKDLSFKINSGDRVGLYGPNGSGKTTLLRLINKIYMPTNGNITISGSVLSLLDISMGLDSDANGYDNIILRGLILGLTHEEIKTKVDEIKEFSELGDYLAAPIRIYSSGMKVRLAFSIITVMKPEILVLDEWLSVGDESFNKKASDKLQEMIEETSILIIASHSKEILNKVCNRIFLLEDGKIHKEIDQFD
jgi:lipopolysaccharide transport system ATP-binding protein